jgi:hypothetical protein
MYATNKNIDENDTNPNSAKGPENGKIVYKLYYIVLTTLELT